MWSCADIEINLGFPQELKVKEDDIFVTNSTPAVFGYKPCNALAYPVCEWL